MSEEMYFAYGLNKENATAQRIYRMVDYLFERKCKDGTWKPAPEQACILAGDDWDYEEITADEAQRIKIIW